MDHRFGYDTKAGRQCPRVTKPTVHHIQGQPFMVIVPVSHHHLYRGVKISDILHDDTARAISGALNDAGIRHWMVRMLDVIGTEDMKQEGIFACVLMVPVPALEAPDEGKNLPESCTFNPTEDYPHDGRLWWLMGNNGMGLEWMPLDKLDHVLIGGTTQWGKTGAWMMPLMSLLLNHGPDEIQVTLIDPKLVNSAWLVSCPHLFCEMCRDDDIDQARTVAEAVFGELQLRKQKFAQVGVTSLEDYNKRDGDKLPHLLFIFDEYLAITLGAQGSHDVLYRHVKKIVNMGRTFGIQVILTTQKPDADAMQSQISSQCNTRIAVHCTTQPQFRIVMGNGINEWMPRLTVKGRVLYLLSGEEKPHLLQMPWITPEKLTSLAYWLGAGATKSVAAPAFALSVLTELQWKVALWSDENTPGRLNRSAIAKALELSPDVVRSAVENLAARSYAHSRGAGLPYAPTPKLEALVQQYKARVGAQVGA